MIHLLLGVILVIASPAVVPVLRNQPAQTAIETSQKEPVFETTVEKLQLESALPIQENWIDASFPDWKGADMAHLSFPSGSNLLAVTGAGSARSLPVQGRSERLMSEFCGTAGSADRICFVVDISGSMVIAHDYVQSELLQAVVSLTPMHHFGLIFFAGGDPSVMEPGYLVRASAVRRQAAVPFIRNAGLLPVAGEQRAWQAVTRALQQAFEMKTKQNRPVRLIYLFTDGQFDHAQVRQVVDQLQEKHAGLVTLNVIACGYEENEPFLKELAGRYKGQYRFITDEELATFNKK